LLTLRAPRFSPFPYTTLFRSGTTARQSRHNRLSHRALAVNGASLPLSFASFASQTRGTGPSVGTPFLGAVPAPPWLPSLNVIAGDRKSTRLNSSHRTISYAVF